MHRASTDAPEPSFGELAARLRYIFNFDGERDEFKIVPWQAQGIINNPGKDVVQSRQAKMCVVN